jgi:hypothetical protein
MNALRTHVSMPFECTYHFIQVAIDQFVMLDVIRSPRGNSLRFFFVKSGELLHHLVVNESGDAASRLSESGDRITRNGAPLNFDLRFSVAQSAMPVAPWNPFSVFAITAHDHPKVSYDGRISYQSPSGEQLSFTFNAAPGTISQHFGRELPDYLYFNTYVQAGEAQLVGAISRVRTALGFRITSAYASVTPYQGKGKTVLSLFPHWQGDGTANAPVVVRSSFGDIEVCLNGAGLAHDIDHANGTTWFNARVTCKTAGIHQRPAVFELRGWPPLHA